MTGVARARAPLVGAARLAGSPVRRGGLLLHLRLERRGLVGGRARSRRLGGVLARGALLEGLLRGRRLGERVGGALGLGPRLVAGGRELGELGLELGAGGLVLLERPDVVVLDAREVLGLGDEVGQGARGQEHRHDVRGGLAHLVEVGRRAGRPVALLGDDLLLDAQDLLGLLGDLPVELGGVRRGLAVRRRGVAHLLRQGGELRLGVGGGRVGGARPGAEATTSAAVRPAVTARCAARRAAVSSALGSLGDGAWSYIRGVRSNRSVTAPV